MLFGSSEGWRLELLAKAVNRAWYASTGREYRAFRQALHNPGAAQLQRLKHYLATNSESAFGRELRFKTITSISEFQRRVPISTYEDYDDPVGRIQRRGTPELTTERVLRLVPTSGTAGRKLIPFTRTLAAEFERGVAPWIHDTFHRRPELMSGPAYWSISPAIEVPSEDGAVPIGYADDEDYLGPLARTALKHVQPVPSAVRRIADIEAFRYVTLLYLLRASALTMLSVWHPSFATLLLRALETHWDSLIEDIATGTVRPPSSLEPATRKAVRRLRPQPARARWLSLVGPDAPSRLWPRLGLVSCWGDAHAEGARSELGDLLRGVEIQPKGLIATEAFVSLPFAGRRPLAIRSHFFEFLDDFGRPHLADELAPGGEYAVVVTTGGGLYRYRLGDRVRVEGLLARTPCLRFAGRDDHVSDRFGEKLSDTFVAAQLAKLLSCLVSPARFALLAPDSNEGVAHYTLYVEADAAPPSSMTARLDELLGGNPHYRYCRRLGQLGPPRVFRVSSDAHGRYIERLAAVGTRLGDIKPPALSTLDGWSERFDGGYVDH